MKNNILIMTHKCDKCARIFKSNYLLQKHINRKYPCDIIFKCHDCNTIFQEKHILDRHTNRKKPCVEKSNKSTAEVLLEITKLKLEDKEKERQFKKEIVELKNKNALEIEKLKTERKEKTVSHINNIHIENKIQNNIKIEQNFIQNINQVYGENPQIISIKDAAESLSTFLLKNDTIAIDMCNEIIDHEKLLKDCLIKMYDRDYNKPIVYNKQLQTYYSLLYPNKIGKLDIVKSDFEEIKDDLINNLKVLLETISSIHTSPVIKTTVLNKKQLREKANEINDIQRSMKDVDMQPIASEVFSHCDDS